MSDFQPQEQMSTEIIDATQNAVIDAVNSVSEMIEKTTTENTFTDPKAHEAFYIKAEFWVGIAFILVVVFLFKPVGKAVKNLLLKRREKIISDLDEAAKLRDDAQVLLAKYERQFLNVQQEVRDIINKTQQELFAYTKSKTDALEHELLKKQKEADNTIASSVEKVRDEMNLAISIKTMEIIRTHLKQNLDNQKRAQLIDNSIANILKKL